MRTRTGHGPLDWSENEPSSPPPFLTRLLFGEPAVTETELFRAYRVDVGYEAPCACGDMIRCQDEDEAAVAEAVVLHNESPVHQQWSIWQDSVHALQRPTRRPCPCHAHGAA